MGTSRPKRYECHSPNRKAVVNEKFLASGIYLDGWEADDVRGISKYTDGYWISGLDFLHQIHCLVSESARIWRNSYFTDSIFYCDFRIKFEKHYTQIITSIQMVHMSTNYTSVCGLVCNFDENFLLI